MPPNMPGYRDSRIYPLDGPDLRKARALASGRSAVQTGPSCTPCPFPGGPGRRRRSSDGPRRDRHRARDQGVPLSQSVRQAVEAGRAVRHRPRQLDGVVRPRVPRRSVQRSLYRPTGLEQLVVLQLREVQPTARPCSEPAGPAPRAQMPSASSTCRSLGTPRPPSRTECPTGSRSSPGGRGASSSTRTST